MGAYKNTKHILKDKIAVKREAAVTKEMTKKLADDKKISKKEMNERILWKKNEVAEYEATTFSIFYNNSLFLALIILASFYVLKGMTPQINYALSMGISSGPSPSSPREQANRGRISSSRGNFILKISL